MPDPNPAAFGFLETRRSRPARTLTGPAPDRTELKRLLKVAARAPDHGKLEPWRFLVLQKPALARLAGTLPSHGEAADQPADKIAKAVEEFERAELAVVVVSSPKPSVKIPEIEQTLSAGAVCMQLLNAALAAGWGANWLSGWASHDATWRESQLGLMPHESIAGILHLGTETSAPPDRPRPDIDAITEWIDA
ncbi:MAG: nitroreductase [Pseudomonadota bacterium]